MLRDYHRTAGLPQTNTGEIHKDKAGYQASLEYSPFLCILNLPRRLLFGV
jgi:hypothetical protein